MTKEELLARLGRIEWNDIEFKEAHAAVPKSAYETVSAFANTQGGWLVFGVREAGRGFEIAGVSDPDRVQNDFLSALRADNKVNHDIAVTARLLDMDGKAVLLFHIPESSRWRKPLYLDGDIRRTFIRRGGADHRCTSTEIERFLRDSSGERWDGAPIDCPLAEAFDTESLHWYRVTFNERNAGHDASLDDETFLAQWGYLFRQGDHFIPTRAAILLFGAPSAVRQMLPRPTLDVRWIPAALHDSQPEVRWLDRIVFEENLITTWRGLVRKYMLSTPVPFSIDPHTLMRNDTPPGYRVFRELAINLLVHQDYADHGRMPVIQFYRDAIRFWNPGDAFGDAEHWLQPGEKEVRNPRIVAAFRRLALCEQAGTGLPMVVNQWRALGHAAPEIENDQSRKAFVVSLPLGDMVEGNLFAAQVTPQVIPQVTPQVTPQVLALASVMSGEMTRREIQMALELVDLRHFRQAYLNPALAAGIIRMTNPDRPRASNQRYLLTDAGVKIKTGKRPDGLKNNG